nr:uncharacterized protein LOC111755236 [Cavia porcellus]
MERKAATLSIMLINTDTQKQTVAVPPAVRKLHVRSSSVCRTSVALPGWEGGAGIQFSCGHHCECTRETIREDTGLAVSSRYHDNAAGTRYQQGGQKERPTVRAAMRCSPGYEASSLPARALCPPSRRPEGSAVPDSKMLGFARGGVSLSPEGDSKTPGQQGLESAGQHVLWDTTVTIHSTDTAEALPGKPGMEHICVPVGEGQLTLLHAGILAGCSKPTA